MKLNGKAKEDFEKWYLIEFENRNLHYIEGLDISDLSIQYGVYVDWFDSVDILINVHPHNSEDWDYDLKDGVYLGLLNTEYDLSPTRQEARTKAIEKANEIYNKQD